MVTVRTNPELLEHLRQFSQDGTNMAEVIFEGGRLAYPGRKDLEYELGYSDPYTLELEARVIEGMPARWNAAVRFLARLATDQNVDEPTLSLIWSAHNSYMYPSGYSDSAVGVGKAPSLDRLVAALVSIEKYESLLATEHLVLSVIPEAAEVVVKGLHSVGLPPTIEGLEELFDGAPPACVGLGLVEL